MPTEVVTCSICGKKVIVMSSKKLKPEEKANFKCMDCLKKEESNEDSGL